MQCDLTLVWRGPADPGVHIRYDGAANAMCRFPWRQSHRLCGERELQKVTFLMNRQAVFIDLAGLPIHCLAADPAEVGVFGLGRGATPSSTTATAAVMGGGQVVNSVISAHLAVKRQRAPRDQLGSGMVNC